MKLLRKLAFLLVLIGSVRTASAQTTQFNGFTKDLTSTVQQTGNVNFNLKPGIDTTISGNARFTPTTTTCLIEAPAITSAVGNGTTTTITVTSTQPWIVGDQLAITGTGTTLDNFTAVAPATINGGALSTVFTIASSFNSTVSTGFAGGLFAAAGTGKCVVTQNSALNPAYTSYQVGIQILGATISLFNTYAIGAGPVDISTIVPTPSQQPSYSFMDLFSNGQTISGLKNFTNSGNVYTGGTFNSPTINTPTITGFSCTSCTLITPSIQQPTFTSQPWTLQSGFNIAISWASPAANRSITFQDPGQTANIAYVVGSFTNGDGLKVNALGNIVDTGQQASGSTQFTTVGGTNYGTGVSSTLIATPVVTGVVFIAVMPVQSLVGVGCSAATNSTTVTITFTAPSGAGASLVLGTGNITGNGGIDTGSSNGFSTGPSGGTIAARAGTNVNFTVASVLNSTGCSTIPQYSVFAKATY